MAAISPLLQGMPMTAEVMMVDRLVLLQVIVKVQNDQMMVVVYLLLPVKL